MSGRLNLTMKAILLFVLVIMQACTLSAVPYFSFSAGHVKEIEKPKFGVFGILENSGSGVLSFRETDTVPLITGQAYGWIIKVSPKMKSITWKEVFELPDMPETWGREEGLGELQISPDRKVAVVEKKASVLDGEISHFWEVASSDPPGEYVIRVYINGDLIETFRFKVKRTDPGMKHSQ